ncbi:MAG: hypothetical protein FWE05_10155 [Defluviitaleaceae bacterium]|nr:hypothetical protein [Defluviitaleaceae bacterium]
MKKCILAILMIFTFILGMTSMVSADGPSDPILPVSAQLMEGDLSL